MFYSHDILRYRSGRFATVWLAATKLSQVTRRDIMTVDIDKTCEALMDYLLHRAQPTASGKVPRMSLYLSALLMNGVVKVYSKQNDYLLADVSSIFCKLVSKFQVAKDINLKDVPSAKTVTFPEYTADDLLPLALDTEQFLLGTDLVMDVLPIEYWSSSSQLTCPETVASAGSSKRKRRKKDMEGADVAPSVSSIDQITMQEPISLRMDTTMSPLPVPKDIDLPMLDALEMEQLMGAGLEEPPLRVSDLLPTSTPLPSAQEQPRRTRATSADRSFLEGDQPPTTDGVLTDLLGPTVNQEVLERTPQQTIPGSSLPETRAIPPSPSVTMNITSPLPRRPAARHSLNLEELQTAPGSRQSTPRRRRRGLMVDELIQVPIATIREGFEHSDQLCTQLLLPNVHASSAIDLLENPGRRELAREPFLSRWKKSARFRRNIDESDMPILRSPSPQLLFQKEEFQLQLESMLQQEAPVDVTMETLRPDSVQDVLPAPVSPVLPQTAEKRRGRKRSSTVDESIEKMRQITSMSESAGVLDELPSMEVVRDASSTLLVPGGLMDDTLVLEQSATSQRDKSSSKKKRSTRSSLAEDEDLLQVNLQTSVTGSSSTHRGLYDVVEEQEPGMIPELADEQRESSANELARTIENEIRQRPGADAGVWFTQLFPPRTVDRKTAARNFCNLLVLCTEGRVEAQQNVFGGDILIVPLY